MKGFLKATGYLVVTNLLIMIMVGVILAILRAFGVQIEPSTMGGLMAMSLIWGFAGSFFSLFASKWLATRQVGAQILSSPATPQERFLFDVVERLAGEWGLKTPQIAVYPSPEPNAFATGPSRNNSLIAVSSGLMEKMTKDEIEGVLAHEMAHVGNGDMMTMTLIQGLMNAFVIFLSRFVAGAIVAFTRGEDDDAPVEGSLAYGLISLALNIVFGVLASIVVMYFSRKREFAADAGSAQHVGKDKMIASLKKLDAIYSPSDLPKEVSAMGISGGAGSLFASHPSIEQRIAALEKTDF